MMRFITLEALCHYLVVLVSCSPSFASAPEKECRLCCLIRVLFRTKLKKGLINIFEISGGFSFLDKFCSKCHHEGRVRIEPSGMTDLYHRKHIKADF